ncbi:MAG TPA: adenylate/guanylate cyclase domain-containing protein [Chthoniobacterales bacterium]|jgi:TolB-like protein/class 3 adenylate cyclase
MPPEATEQRKLAAIMFTDMVGYSALSQRDDKLALELLEEHRELLREIFPRFHGTEIKTIGDAFLVEFNSALEAAQCAIEIQRTLTKRNSDIAPDRRIELKIGIHIGDVVHRGGDVYGDGVNIASRIEPIAGPGGICVSMDVERQIRNAVETRFEKLAPTELKNISVPMDLFRIVLPWERQAQPAAKSEIRSSKSETARSPRPKIVIGIVLLAAALSGGAILWYHRGRPAENTTPQNPGAVTTSIPDQSIAVLPFENLSSDKDNAYFAEGIQDEILTHLAKIAALKVISRSSTQKYKSVPDNLREVGQQLGVANLLEGSVQKAGNAVHINVQLIKAATDAHLWAESYDRELQNIFGVEGEVAGKIADALDAKLTGAEEKALAVRPTTNIDAYEAYLQGRTIEATRYDLPGEAEVGADYQRAVQLDPSFALAWARLTVVRCFLYYNTYDLTTNSPAAIKEEADRAMALQPELGESWIAQGNYRRFVLHDYPGALQAYAEAEKRIPNSADVFGDTALVERRMGRWDAAVSHFRKAILLDPRNLQLNIFAGETLGYLRNFAEGENFVDRALQISADTPQRALMARIAVLQAEGRVDDAAKANARLVLFERSNLEGFKATQLFYERRFDAAIAQLQSSKGLSTPGSPLEGWQKTLLPLYGYCQQMSGRTADARATFTRSVQEIKPSPTAVVPVDLNFLRCALALSYAGLGEKDKAIAEARQAVTEYSDDAINKPMTEIALAQVQAQVGDVDAAVTALPHLLEVPAGLTPGLLRIDPFWDPLRKDPRFQKLCEEPNK